MSLAASFLNAGTLKPFSVGIGLLFGLSTKEIPVNRFSKKDNDVKTYDPPVKDTGTGTNFHYGLPFKGADLSSGVPCIGAYSAGCQVIPTEEKWNEFWALVKKSGQQIFWYSIIEEDKI